RLGFTDKRAVSPQDPSLVLIIDEASALTSINNPKVQTFDGLEWTASALLDVTTSVARSAGCELLFSSQRGLVDALGTHGTNTMRNIMCRIVGRTTSAHDGRQTLHGIKGVAPTALRDNTQFVQPNQEEPRAIPSKFYALHQLDQIIQLAYAYTDRRPLMPQWLVEEMGDSYTGRWDQDRQEDLANFLKAEEIPYPHVP